MIVNDLKIRNFRCFKDFSTALGSRATVLFGKNGTGKSTLLAALRKALSFTMYSDIVYKTDSTTKKKVVDYTRTITSGNPYLSVRGFSKLGDFNSDGCPLIEIEATAELASGQPIGWSMSAFTNKNRLRTSTFIDAFLKFYDYYKLTGDLPLLAYYSDSFPHKEDSKKSVVKSKISDLRNFGYFDWDAEEGCTKEWLTRLENNFKNIISKQNLLSRLENEDSKEAIRVQRDNIQKWQEEIDAIEGCLKRFSTEIAVEEDSLRVLAIGLHSEFGRLCIITQGGEEILFTALPAGYKRLFSIVLDLAFRAYILSEKTSTDLQGVAIIDEIDLHLHPELENVVLPALLSTFPKIQFIVSTHSYGVLTNLQAPGGSVRIMKMLKNSSEPWPMHDIYGLDPGSVLQEVMGVRLNGRELKRMVEQCAYMLLKDLRPQAENLKKIILTKTSISREELDRRVDEELRAIR